jgi:lipid-binding SYLF domain-containing protein
MKEAETVRDASQVLNEIMAIPNQSIPAGLLRDAQAVAIIPHVIKGSFVVGARHGNGVLLVRNPEGGWHAPVFISLTGGNIGWQIGVQSTDVILVFKTMQSVNGLLSGKFTLGADAAIAAGPVGRNAAAATDGRFQAQILSYSRSRGLFAGVALDGSVIQVSQMSNAVYYQQNGSSSNVVVPEAAQQLTRQIAAYSQSPAPFQPASAQLSPATPGTQPAAQPQTTSAPTALAQQHSLEEMAMVRDQLARLAPRLFEKLDLPWQQYLALPAEVFYGNQHPPVEKLNESLARFETVKTDPRYRDLANLPEFQSTYGLLKHYVTDLTPQTNTLVLPEPPGLGSGQ